MRELRLTQQDVSADGPSIRARNLPFLSSSVMPMPVSAQRPINAGDIRMSPLQTIAPR
jgi:hypothetical protein